eukprot:TRINITY_DN1570_c0_g1_i1.p1 TRINITY_DN1570_c0_g1~~TRINITY_DN1570_c0_g1_i1.p1  ORF type:complete len:432 (+),score=110.42 TRINITY_DN1570_c0_g1_i1:75-1370(+)
MALRMTGHLLLGVSRIHARQVKYLLNDCNDALVKIKMVFRTGEVQADNIHPEETVANYNAITLPEGYGEMELSIPEISLDEIVAPENLLNINLVMKRQRDIRLTEFEGEERMGEDLLRNYAISADEPDAELEFDHDVPVFDPHTETHVELPPSKEDTPASHRSQVGTPVLPDPFEPELNYDGLEDPLVTPPTPINGKKITKEPKKGIAVDQSTILPKAVQKRGLEDTSDLIRDINPAPPSKKAMMQREKELAGAEAIFGKPSVEGFGSEILKLFSTLQKNKNGLPIELPTTGEDVMTPGIELEPELEAPGYDEGPTDFEYPDPETMDDFEPTPSRESRVEREQGQLDSEKWTERTKKIHAFLDKTFTADVDEISYLKLVEGKTRKVVVGTFFELLVLKSRDIISLKQPKAYGDIQVFKTDHFNSVPQSVSA